MDRFHRVRFLLPLLLIALSIHAQSMGTGTIKGIVTDQTGAAVAGASVTATNGTTNIIRTVRSDGQGNFVLPDLQIGLYSLKAEAPGFQILQQNNVHLDADATAAVDLKLAVGSKSQTVLVSSAPPLIQTQNGEISNTVTGTQVSELALNGRNFTQYLSFSPGVASSQTGRRMGVGQEGNPLLSINGGRANDTKYTFDGILAMDTGGNRGVDLFPPMDAIAEVQVKTSNFSADQGSYGYGLVNLITKAGGSSFHGDAYEVWGNGALDARNYFSTAVVPFHQNLFGCTLGGPVFIPGHYNSQHKNKTFFFVSEGWNLRQGPQLLSYTAPPQSTFTATTVTAAQRAGIFSSTITDPSTGQPFPNNTIPASDIDPNATVLLNRFFPLPNRTGNPNYSYNTDSAMRWREDLVRIDQTLTSIHSLTIRYAHDNWYENQQIYEPSNASFPTEPGYLGKPGWNAIIRLTSVLSASVVNVFTDGYSRNAIQTYPNAAANSRAGLNIPEVIPGNYYGAAPNVSINGFSTIGIGSPNSNVNNLYEWKDDLNLVRGNHSMKFGIDFLRMQKFDYNAVATQGAFTFNGSYTGNPVADFLLGRAFSYTESSQAPNGYYFANADEEYAQDDWKVYRNLTVNLGLRWSEFLGAPIGYEKYNNIANFSPALYNPNQAPKILADGEISPGTGKLLNGIFTPANRQGLDVPRDLVDHHFNMPGPRVGFAWSLPNSPSTVIRGGYGIFYHWDNTTQENLRENPPFTSSVSIYNTLLSNPAGGTARLYPATLQAAGISFYYPSVQQWSLGVERQIPGQIVASVTYVGNHAAHLDQEVNINQPHPNLAVAQGKINVNTVVPYLGFGSITYDERNGAAQYSALQTTATRRFDNGFGFEVAYTYSKALVWNAGQDPTAQPNEEGLNSYDQRHNVTLNYVYDLPSLAHRGSFVALLTDGWETTGNATFASGFPYTVTISGDRAGVGGGTQRPNVIARVQRTGHPVGFFSTSSFALAPLGSFGDEGSNAWIGPGISDDFTMNFYKNFSLPHETRLRLGGEFFNIFNHPNFSAVGTVYGSPTFGNATAALDPRNVQISGRLTF